MQWPALHRSPAPQQTSQPQGWRPVGQGLTHRPPTQSQPHTQSALLVQACGGAAQRRSASQKLPVGHAPGHRPPQPSEVPQAIPGGQNGTHEHARRPRASDPQYWPSGHSPRQ